MIKGIHHHAWLLTPFKEEYVRGIVYETFTERCPRVEKREACQCPWNLVNNVGTSLSFSFYLSQTLSYESWQYRSNSEYIQKVSQAYKLKKKTQLFAVGLIIYG